MRIPFPERVNLTHALLFAIVLSGIQILQGTNPWFSGCVFCFILVAAVAFNVSGGVVYPSGAFVLFNAIFVVLLPCVVKAFLGDPADAYLRTPLRTMEIYLCGMVGIFIAVCVSQRFRPRRALISSMLPKEGLRTAYIGSAVLSVLITLYLTFLATGGGNGSFTSFLLQVDRFPMLTFVLGVVYTVQRTDGRRSVSWPLIGMMLYLSLGAFFTFSKEQFLGPPFAWAVTVALLRYRLDWLNAITFGLGVYFLAAYMIPYAAYGRGFVVPNMDRYQVSAYLLTHMDEVRANYDESMSVTAKIRFYDRQRGLLSRLEVFSVDDALIDLTDHEGTFGFEPVIEGIENMVPHIFWPDKPTPFFGNVYAHEIGIIVDEDETTGVSFSPAADAYREGGIFGVLVIEPLCLMAIFLILDSVIGNVRLNPVGLLTTILVSRSASEGMLFGQFALVGQFLISNVIAALICAYVLPVLGYAFAKSPFTAAGRTLPPSLTTPPAPLPVTSL